MSPPTPTRTKPAPNAPAIERRRRKRGPLTRLLSGPVDLDSLGRRVEQALGSTGRRLLPWLSILGVAAPIAVVAIWLWNRPPLLTPRHRAEALCFTLAQQPVFSPPLRVEPQAALIGGFTPLTPPAIALRLAMHFTDDMVIRERSLTVGDYKVAILWLGLPPASGGRHWLTLGWMEGSDLAVCSFRFPGEEPELTADEITWGDRLVTRLLVPENFRADALPAVRLRATRDGRLPMLGPQPAS